MARVIFCTKTLPLPKETSSWIQVGAPTSGSTVSDAHRVGNVESMCLPGVLVLATPQPTPGPLTRAAAVEIADKLGLLIPRMGNLVLPRLGGLAGRSSDTAGKFRDAAKKNQDPGR